jgi:hypothetical protein
VYALFAHGYHRATEDIDLLVPPTRESGNNIRNALMVLPGQAAVDLDPSWFEAGENIRVADAFIVDILFTAAGQTWATLRRYAETIDFDGIPVKTVDLQGLLKSEQTSREKDAADRQCIPSSMRNENSFRCRRCAGCAARA